MEALIQISEQTNAKLISIAEQLDPASEVTLPYVGKSYRYPVRFFLVDAVAHGIEPRTEVKLNLASVGVETPDLDGWEYSAAAGYGTEA
jgi:hypothetical protein